MKKPVVLASYVKEMSVVVNRVDLPGGGDRHCWAHGPKVVENAERSEKSSGAYTYQGDENVPAIIPT